MKKGIYILLCAVMLSSCNSFKDCRRVDAVPEIFPDYTDIAIPVNISPLNFKFENAKGFELEIRGKYTYTFKTCSDLMQFNEKKWKGMLLTEQGNKLNITLRAKVDGESLEFRSFCWDVRNEPVDKYLSYRLIEPAYEVWNVISVEERDVESFKTRTLADNIVTENTCFNCHTSNRAADPVSFFHVRGPKGGTLLNRNGELRKIDTATDSTAGAAVYGEISQDGRFGIFTTADIRPILHSDRLGRFEVFDDSSDLIVIDFENNTVCDSPLVKGSEFQETFPCWTPDGRTIFFCRAESHPQPEETKEMHYNLCAISFNPETGRLGDTVNVVFDAEAEGKSISFPKCSPDGTKILFCVSDYGTFPIWHPETDMWMIDLSSGELNKMEGTNAQYSDSYHCWSSNGRWICWASKRADRVYGRPYFAYVDEDGKVSKAFVLPQENPESYITTLKSYNIPELYCNAEEYDAKYVSRFYSDMEAEKFAYTK